LQRIANILSTEAPTEIGATLEVIQEKSPENRDLGWLFFDLGLEA
jgi:hypothetical protein